MKEISAGDKISLIIANPQNRTSTIYESKVRHVVDKNGRLIQIEMPQENDDLPIDWDKYRTDAKLLVVLYSGSGVTTRAAMFVKEADNVVRQYLLLRLSGGSKTVQRRAHVRFKRRIYTEFTRTTDGSAGSGMILDISRGGIKFQSAMTLEAGDYVNFNIQLNEAVIRPVGEVLEHLELENEPAEGINTYRVSFSQIEPDEEEWIGHFIRLSRYGG